MRPPLTAITWVGQRITCDQGALILTFSGKRIVIPKGGSCFVERGAMLSIFSSAGEPMHRVPLIDVAVHVSDSDASEDDAFEAVDEIFSQASLRH